jgi:hypothetical protein
MRVTAILPLLLVLGGPVSAADAAGAHDQPTVRHALGVETTGGKLRVRVVVENCSQSTIHIPREIATGEEITGRRFDLRDARGNPVAYTGMMVKRGALGPDDYYPVAPRSVHAHTIDITPSYAFDKGTHSYTIGYDGPWLPDVARLDEVRHSPAPPVRFSLTLP